jgi:hypothetical protein
VRRDMAEHPHDLMPDEQRHAFAQANAVLIDAAINSLEELATGLSAADAEITAYLPAIYRSCYNEQFIRRFLVCLTIAGLVEEASDLKRLSCVAEEIAFVVTAHLAGELMLAQGESHNTSHWRQLLTTHFDIEMMFEYDVSTPVDSAENDAHLPTALHFSHWFEPLRAGALLHPYLQGDVDPV